MIKFKAYIKSPVWVQEQLLSLRAYTRKVIREGKAFRQELKEIERTQWLGHEAIQRMRLERVQKVVRHAALHVPYYRESFAAAGFNPDQLVSLEDMKRIPVLSKRNVFDSGESMLADNVSWLRFTKTTSGTSGMSIKVIRNLHSIIRENAFIWRQYRWAGGQLGDRRAWIREDRIVPINVNTPPFWRYIKSDNVLMMSLHHLTEQSAELYIRALEEFDPKLTMVYPSALYVLVRYMVLAKREYRGRSLNGFVTSSETVTDELRQLTKQTFGCNIFDWYGSAERVSAIGTCEHGCYHVLSDYGYTELVPQDDGTCEVIGTSFDNFLMPLIRYRLGDYVTPAEDDYICPCGRAFPVAKKIIGRESDYLLASDGRHLLGMGMILDHIPNLLAGQVRQESLGEVRILLVLSPGKWMDEKHAITQARAYLGDEFRIKIQQVDEIPRTSSGKIRDVIRTF